MTPHTVAADNRSMDRSTHTRKWNLSVIAMSDQALARAAVAISLVVWGSAFPAIRIALRAYSPAHLSLFRLATAAVALGLVARHAGVRRPARGDAARLALLGLLGMTLYQLLLGAGETTVPAGTASLIVAANPVMVAILAHLGLGERLTLAGWLGISIAVLGTAVVTLGQSGGLTVNGGAALVVGAAFVQALFFVLQKPLLTKYTPLEVTFYATAMGALLLAPAFFGLPQEIASAPFEATLAVLFLGLASSAVGFMAWAYALKRVEVSLVASSLNALPVVALGVSWLLLGESPAAVSLIGGGTALVGVAITNLYGKSSKASVQRVPRLGQSQPEAA